jgi:hypothetical protein
VSREDASPWKGAYQVSGLMIDGFDAFTRSTVPQGKLVVIQYHITKVHSSEARVCRFIPDFASM